jgi:hypothetical protein
MTGTLVLTRVITLCTHEGNMTGTRVLTRSYIMYSRGQYDGHTCTDTELHYVLTRSI